MSFLWGLDTGVSPPGERGVSCLEKRKFASGCGWNSFSRLGWGGKGFWYLSKRC